MKRLLTLLMVLLLCAALPTEALAASTRTVYVSATGSGSLNLRGGPGKDYEPVGYVYHGDKVIPGRTSGEWTRVKVSGSGATGWIKTKYIDGTTKSLGTGTWKVTASSAVNLRSGPGTGYGIRGAVQPGSRVKVLNTEDEWIRVTVQSTGATGWIRASAIGGKSAASSASSSSGSGASAEPDVQEVRTVTAGELNVRSGPGSGNKLVGALEYGTAVRVMGSSGKWLRIRAYNGVTGWVASAYTDVGATASVTAQKLNVRKGPSSASDKVGALLADDTCEVTSVTSSGWAKVSSAFISGYVSTKYLDFE